MKRFLADRQGNIAIIAALGIPVFAGGLALGTEAGYWLAQKSQLAAATDALAVTASELRDQNATADEIKAIATKSLTDSGYPAATDVAVSFPDDRVIVVDATMPATKYFSGVIYKDAVNISAHTKISLVGDPVCLLALNPTKPAAFKMTGNSLASLDKCVVAANSSSNSAINLGGSSALSVDCLYAVGGVNAGNHATTTCPTPYINQKAITDPLANVVRPTSVVCGNMATFAPNTNYSINPGCFSSGTDVKGNVTFNPGTYILDNTDLNINSGAIIDGAGVTFVLKGSAKLNFNGGATIRLSAPTKASLSAYAGILFLGSNSGARDHFIAGNAASVMNGIAYLPKDNITFTGDSRMNTSCMRLIADTIELTGNSGFKSDCSGKLGSYNPSTSTGLKIIE